MEKAWNLKRALKKHGKGMEFEKGPKKLWETERV